MRIEGTRVGHVGEHSGSERAHGARHGHQQAAPAASNDTAEASFVVSTAASAITQASGRDQAAQAERLATVRAQLQTGTYKVDHDALARKLVDEELARRG